MSSLWGIYVHGSLWLIQFKLKCILDKKLRWILAMKHLKANYKKMRILYEYKRLKLFKNCFRHVVVPHKWDSESENNWIIAITFTVNLPKHLKRIIQFSVRKKGCFVRFIFIYRDGRWIMNTVCNLIRRKLTSAWFDKMNNDEASIKVPSFEYFCIL